MIVPRVSVVVVLLAVTTIGFDRAEPLPCSVDQLASFKQTTIAGPVNKCMSASEVKFGMPPTADLTETQRDQICSERMCKEMIATIDDMDIPRCDLLYNGKNVTLQASLDKFTSICDAPRSPVPEIKKRGVKKNEGTKSAAATTRVSNCYGTLVIGSLLVLAASVF